MGAISDRVRTNLLLMLFRVLELNCIFECLGVCLF